VLVFGHRGACGYLPENTIESMELAFEQGADAVEFDVVFTKDGQAIIRHDLDLASTTDINDHSFLSTKIDQLTKEDVSRLRAKERKKTSQGYEPKSGIQTAGLIRLPKTVNSLCQPSASFWDTSNSTASI